MRVGQPRRSSGCHRRGLRPCLRAVGRPPHHAVAVGLDLPGGGQRRPPAASPVGHRSPAVAARTCPCPSHRPVERRGGWWPYFRSGKRTAVVLRHVVGLTGGADCRRMGVTRSTVSSALASAHRTLGRLMAAPAEEAPVAMATELALARACNENGCQIELLDSGKTTNARWSDAVRNEIRSAPATWWRRRTAKSSGAGGTAPS